MDVNLSKNTEYSKKHDTNIYQGKCGIYDSERPATNDTRMGF